MKSDRVKVKILGGNVGISGEMISRTRAAEKLIDAAETMGILENLSEQLSWRCGIVEGGTDCPASTTFPLNDN